MIKLMVNQKIQQKELNQTLAKRTQSDKVLRNKVFKIAGDPKYDGYQREPGSMVYKFFDKKSSGG